MFDPLSIGVAACAVYGLQLTVRSRAAFAVIAGGEPEPVQGELTLMQPILGGDPCLAECLSANAGELAGDVRLLWLVDESDAVGQAAARAAAEGHPDVEVRVCPDSPPHVNPKAFKLALGLEALTTEFVGVLDDDTTVDRELVARTLGSLAAADLATGLPCYRAGGGLGSALIEGFVNASSPLTYLPPLARGPAVTLNGMFYVTRRATLEGLGGFSAIASQLCDDLALARAYRDAGLTIAQGWRCQVLVTRGVGLRESFGRMHRWMVFALVLLRRLDARTSLRIALELGTPPLLLWTALGCGLFAPAVLVALALVLLLRQRLLGTLLRRVSGGAGRLPVVASLVAELLQPLHVLHAAARPVIRWRGRALRVRTDGSFESLARSRA